MTSSDNLMIFTCVVHKLQPSDKKSHCLNLQYEDSFFRFENGKHVQHLKHPAQEFALNLCAYITVLMPALKCRMDYQTTDGVAMLLRYVTSYVTKSHDCSTIHSMYSYKFEGRHAAMRHLMHNMPAEPEMWFFLFSKKVAWSSSRTKRFTVRTSENAMNDKTVQKYWKRSNDCENLTMMEWLCLFDTRAAKSHSLPVSLQVFALTSRAHGESWKSHGIMNAIKMVLIYIHGILHLFAKILCIPICKITLLFYIN